MNISEMMTEDCIIVDSKATTKRQLLQEVAQKSSSMTGIDERIIFDTLLERENLGSTGFGRGTALPHARLPGLKQVHSIFVKLDTAIDFESIDNKPVDLLFALLSPEDCGGDHLTALAKVSRVLKDESTCTKLRQIDSLEEIFAILSANE